MINCYEGISKEPTISSLICIRPSAQEKSYCTPKRLPCEIIMQGERHPKCPGELSCKKKR